MVNSKREFVELNELIQYYFTAVTTFKKHTFNIEINRAYQPQAI